MSAVRPGGIDGAHELGRATDRPSVSDQRAAALTATEHAIAGGWTSELLDVLEVLGIAEVVA